MILFLLQIYFNIFKKVFPLKNTIKRTFSALSRTSFSHCGKFSPKLKEMHVWRSFCHVGKMKHDAISAVYFQNDVNDFMDVL